MDAPALRGAGRISPSSRAPLPLPLPLFPSPHCSGVEMEVRPSRLGLARVSVLRGQGPAKGAACIDDYIRSVEPVYDYLTKFRCDFGASDIK